MQSVEMALKTGEIGDEAEVRQAIRGIVEEHRGSNGAIIRILQGAQNLYGYLPAQVMRLVSEEYQVPLSEVSGIVSFYSFFSTVPKGKRNSVSE